MGDKVDQIERHIAQQRSELRDNIVDLERKVSRAVDWRTHVEKRPIAMVGLAFGGGLLLSALIGGESRSDDRKLRRLVDASGMTPPKPAASAAWDNVKGALLGVAVAKLGTVVEDLLPGFQDQYKKAQSSRTL